MSASTRSKRQITSASSRLWERLLTNRGDDHGAVHTVLLAAMVAIARARREQLPPRAE
jgi:hypothetical protein